MNSLIITLCILITAETEILLATDATSKPQMGNVIREDEYSSSGVTEPKLAFGAAGIGPCQPLPCNYNTDTAIQPKESGYFNNAGTDQKMLGSYNYIDDKGNIFQVSYVANENGFQLRAEKKADIRAYVPPLIKKALQYIAKHSEGNGK